MTGDSKVLASTRRSGDNPIMPRTLTNARSVVCDHLAQIIPAFPDLPLGGPDLSQLEARDAALARAIDGAVRRRWLSLEAILRVRLNRDIHVIEPGVRAALLSGAAQLLLLERLPDHAVLHETVEWTKRHVRPEAGNFVNAVLRAMARLRDEGARRSLAGSDGTERLEPGADGTAPDKPTPRELGRNELPLEDGAVLALREDVFAIDPVARLSAQTSHVPGLVMRWMSTHGTARTRAACLHGIALPPTILHGAPLEIDAAHASLAPHDRPGCAVYTGAPAELASLLAVRAGVWVQDPASAAAIDACAAMAGERPAVVVDLCAGKGTKTRQLAHAFPGSRVLAADPDPQRFAALNATFASAGGASRSTPSATVEVVAQAHVERRVRELGGAALVVLDVPCSNSGVLARRLEARYRFSAVRLHELVELQRTIARTGVALLRPEGRLLYATCSLEPEENELQWRWIETELGLQRIAAEALLPAGLPGDPAARWHDGGAWALFSRRSAG